MKSWRIVAVLLLCLVLAGSTGCGLFGGGSQEETSQQLVEVVRGDLTVSVSGSGNIGVSNEAKLVFGTSGRIDKIYVNEGNKVTQGEVLAKLETAPLELVLTQAQAGLAQTQAGQAQAQIALDAAEVNRDKIEDYLELLLEFLDKSDSRVEAAESQVDTAKLQLEMAESQLEATELQLEAAKQSLEQAQKQLARATITTPFDGVVASVGVDEGDTVSAATTIVHLIDLNSMELKVGVDEIDIPSVKPNQRGTIEVDALPAIKFEGRVSAISQLSTVQAGLVQYDVTIDFNSPEGSDLKIGMSATADIILNERNNVLLVPSGAITQDNQGNPIVKVIVNEQIQERTIVIGISDAYQTEIVGGLQEGEIVVVEIQAATTPSGAGGFLFGG